MKAETMFKDYNKMKREMAFLELQLQSFTGLSVEDMITSMTFTGEPEGDRVQTSCTSDKTCSIALDYRKRLAQENADYYRFLYDKYAEIKKEIDFFENGIRSLGEKKADIVFEMLDGDLTWDEISTQYGISRTSLSRARKAAIDYLDRLYAQRERMEIEYMLS